MIRKTAIFSTLILASTAPVVAGEMINNSQSEALRLMEQTRVYAQQENQYKYYAATDSNQQMSQDKSRNMYGADNDTGQGEMKRERKRNRDGSGSGNNSSYGQASSGNGQYGAGGSGGGKGAGGGGRR
jgi:uncharacterized membrane protein YgcG